LEVTLKVDGPDRLKEKKIELRLEGVKKRKERQGQFKRKGSTKGLVREGVLGGRMKWEAFPIKIVKSKRKGMSRNNGKRIIAISKYPENREGTEGKVATLQDKIKEREETLQPLDPWKLRINLGRTEYEREIVWILRDSGEKETNEDSFSTF